MKYNLDDTDLQNISDKLRNILEVKYKDELGGIPDHIVTTLCQNYVIQCKDNKMDIEKLLNDHNITLDK
jgi:hypothetical protein